MLNRPAQKMEIHSIFLLLPFKNLASTEIRPQVNNSDYSPVIRGGSVFDICVLQAWIPFLFFNHALSMQISP